MKHSSHLDCKLSKAQYIQLSEICDDLVHCNLLNKAVVAQDFLHVSRYSPLMSKSYIRFYKRNILNVFLYVLSIYRNAIHFVKNIFNSIAYRELDVSAFDKEIDYLFISHYTGKNKNQKYFDSYFGEVIKRIDIDDVKVAIAYINHTSHKSMNVSDNNQIDSVLLDNKISFFRLIQIYKESLFSLFQFNSVSKNIISKRLTIKAWFGVLAPGTIRTQIIANHVQSLVTALSPKHLVTTYEGHAWERLCFSLAREVDPSIKCIAYQHAPIFKYQHAIKRGIGNNYDPDIIFTSGTVPENQLLSCGKLINSKILSLGSGRFAPKLQGSNKNGFKTDTCLVTPEGTILECSVLFGFALECAKKLKDVNFIWRFPPTVDIAMLQKTDGKFKILEENISISKISLEGDIKASSHILYRGSSVVIPAVSSGLKPIYFMQDGELSMDPLFQCQEGERVVKKISDFEEKIQDSKVVSEKLKSHCRDIYTDINIKILKSQE
jgi:hypothetical protein